MKSACEGVCQPVLTARVGWQKACVAMANKNARILWAAMTRETEFDVQHVSQKPKAQCKPEAAGAAPLAARQPAGSVA